MVEGPVAAGWAFGRASRSPRRAAPAANAASTPPTATTRDRPNPMTAAARTGPATLAMPTRRADQGDAGGPPAGRRMAGHPGDGGGLNAARQHSIDGPRQQECQERPAGDVEAGEQKKRRRCRRQAGRHHRRAPESVRQPAPVRRRQEEEKPGGGEDGADLELTQADAAAKQAERCEDGRIADRGREDGEQDDRRLHGRSIDAPRARAK